ncbi:hypothetical protein [Maribacter sp. 2210JD10-5]|uniref:hypothetical protein n=1 Tax=Maribacter sp. 2210JD10-5 TaxID=3386272 RepID=UPI0039BC8A31
MQNQNKYYFGLFLLMSILAYQPVDAQILKKFKKKIEDKVVKKADTKTDEILNGEKSKQKNNTDHEQQHTSQTSKESNSKSQTINKKKGRHNTVITDNSDLLVFKSPTTAFKDIVIQKFNGLPRFGLQNRYMSDYQNPDRSREIGEKLQRIDYNGFEKLVKIHFMKDYFKNMDKTALTAQSRSPKKVDVESYIAQQLILRFASNMATQETILKYFCSQPRTDGSCTFSGKWGGKDADSFTENEKYIAFLDEHLDTILKWSDAFFEDDGEEVYSVTSHKISNYDFDNMGYWVSLPMRQHISGIEDSDHSNYFFEYLPQTTYGNTLFNKISEPEYYNAIVLVKIDPEIAESQLSEWNTKTLYFATKTKLVFKEIYKGNLYLDRPSYTYHYTDPIIEVYTKLDLLEKVSEVDMEHLTFKKHE